MLRVRDFTPPPHDFEHGVHDRLHGFMTQSTAQAAALHVFVWTVASHAWPPKAAFCTMRRVRRALPPPHVREQSLQRVHGASTHLIGHFCVLHFSSL